MGARSVVDDFWGDPSLKDEIARADVKAGVPDTRRRVIEQRYGQRGVDAVAAALSAEDRALFLTPPLVTTWVSLDKLARIDEAITKVHLRGDASQMGAIADEAATFELHVVYTYLLKLGSPEWVLKRLGTVFGAKARPGLLRETNTAHKQAWLELVQMVMPHYYVAHVMPSWAMRAVLLTGGKDPRVELIESPHYGDRRTFWHVQWR
ncbi:MAG: hypothetical protein U0269_23910 [Polyangiales bacterium]